MSRNITKIETLLKLEKLKRVAAYARVSNGKDAMLHSLSAQISYYNGLIQNHSGWEFCGVYADEAKSGTRDNRENFVRFINDCGAGRIDACLICSGGKSVGKRKSKMENTQMLSKGANCQCTVFVWV